MKGFRVCNHNLDNWIERRFHNAIDVARFIKNKNLSTYEIEWKTPVTGEYTTLIFVENGIKTFESNVFKIPATLKKLNK